jgi:hypothetical protein
MLMAVALVRRLGLVREEVGLGWWCGGDILVDAGHGKGWSPSGGARLCALDRRVAHTDWRPGCMTV